VILPFSRLIKNSLKSSILEFLPYLAFIQLNSGELITDSFLAKFLRIFILSSFLGCVAK
jgi:hypothetical protein